MNTTPSVMLNGAKCHLTPNPRRRTAAVTQRPAGPRHCVKVNIIALTFLQYNRVKISKPL